MLVHQDTEIVDADFCRRARQALSDPSVGVVGCVGAIGVTSIAWWEGSVTLSSFANRYEEHGGGELPGLLLGLGRCAAVRTGGRGGHARRVPARAVAVDGAQHPLRRGRSSEFHGYDLDFCLQVREAGRKVITADIRAIHHRPLEMLPDAEPWVEAHIRVAEKWDGRIPGIGTAPGSWEERARRAEAERDAARALAYTKKLELQARSAPGRARARRTRGAASPGASTAPLRLLARR